MWHDHDVSREIGGWMLDLAEELYPLFRSVTGPGLRATLERLGREIPLVVHEVPSGTRVLDWTIPQEWIFRDACIEDMSGRRVIDARSCNLNVVGYSEPVDRLIGREELELHLHSLPERPDWIPYRSLHFGRGWGFCVSQRQRAALTDPVYRIRIDAEHVDGALSYGEVFWPGDCEDEFLVFTHACHPSLANDNLSGLAVCTAAARLIGDVPRRYGVRFVFAPTTIGSIAWLARNRSRLGLIRGGLVVSNVGDAAELTYKRSRCGGRSDAAAMAALADLGVAHRILPFSPWGYDERQFCSPGFDLPIGRLTRSAEGEYPEYHTSADDLSLLDGERLCDSLRALITIVHVIDRDRILRNREPFGEPQLGRRGLHRPCKVPGRPTEEHLATLWALSLCDGSHSLVDVALRAGLGFRAIDAAASRLEAVGLLEDIDAPPDSIRGGDR